MTCIFLRKKNTVLNNKKFGSKYEVVFSSNLKGVWIFKYRSRELLHSCDLFTDIGINLPQTALVSLFTNRVIAASEKLVSLSLL